ncbi:hypothetical protein [Taklimakanibacter deserti]|uniref:hypothetical protein n=1 Tax=Taklimakanibacter deserti TaxID=2267839 RepID=UPI0013C42B58
MRTMKWALLGSAAIAVTATAARADDLADLKAQIEALQTRVSQLEAQPQASAPSGYSLLSIRDGQGTFEGVLPERYGDRVRDDQGFTLSVVPTADAAPVAEVSVSGEIRTALIYTDIDDTHSDDTLDVANRGRIFIKGKVDTAVGEVGGYFRLEASGGGNFNDYSESVNMNKAYGWWKFAPEWELMAGYNDNTGALQTSYDWLVSSLPIRTVGPSNVNNEQFRLTFTSGPLAFAISVEDPDNITTVQTGTAVVTTVTGPGTFVVLTTSTSEIDKSDIPNLQAYLMYSSDAFTAQIVGLLQDDEFGSTDWAIGGGATVGIADSFTFLAAAVVGEGTSSYANNVSPVTTDDEFWGGSIGVIANVSEDTRLELGIGYEDYDVGGEALGFNGGIFWDPVSQVTLGFGATYVEFNDFVNAPGSTAGIEDDGDSLQVWFGTFLRFP